MHAIIDCPGPRLAICRLSGSLDRETLEHLRAAMAACAAFAEVQLDLSGVVFVDSGALGVVVAGVRRVHERSGSVVGWGAPPRIARLLAAAGFERVVAVSDGAVSAIGRPLGSPADHEPSGRSRGARARA